MHTSLGFAKGDVDATAQRVDIEKLVARLKARARNLRPEHVAAKDKQEETIEEEEVPSRDAQENKRGIRI